MAWKSSGTTDRCVFVELCHYDADGFSSETEGQHQFIHALAGGPRQRDPTLRAVAMLPGCSLRDGSMAVLCRTEHRHGPDRVHTHLFD